MILAKINGTVDSVLRKQHAVSAYPTLVMLEPDGEEVDRIVGYLPADAFLKKLRDYRNGIGTLADLLEKAKTNQARTLAFEIADKYKYRGKEEEATAWYQKVIDRGEPTDSLSGEGRMAVADMYRRDKDYDRAVSAFSDIMKDLAGSRFAEDAEVWRAIVYKQKGDTATAIAAFEDFLKHYSESDATEYVQGQISKLKGEQEEEK
jgi:tetratricopeptide (TPR) repeat protein